MEAGGSYDAFISYSHAADGQLAPALQSTLQRYAKAWYRRRALRVFRDQTGLSANPHLWTSIVDALDSSQWFIVLSSPDAARSEWVGREIAHWVEHKGAERILPVVTDGTWSWDEGARDLDRASTAAHPELFGVFEEEPRHVDLTWARSEVQVDPRDGRFLDAVAELAAPLRGVPKDELAGEEVRQHRRTVRTAWTAATALAVLLVLALVAGVLAFVQRDEARDQRTRAEEQTVLATGRSVAAQAVAQAPVRLDISLLLGVEAVARDRSPEAVQGLLTGLNGASRLVGFHPELGEGVTALAVAPDGATVAVAEAGGAVRLVAVDGWRTTAEAEVDDVGVVDDLGFVEGGVAVAGTRGASVLSVPDLEPVGDAVTGAEGLALVVVAPDGRRAAVASGADVEVRDLPGGATTGRWRLPCGGPPVDLAWAPGGDVLATTCREVGLALLDPSSGEVVGRSGTTAGSSVTFSPDGGRVAVTGAEAVTVFDRSGPAVVATVAVPRPRTARFLPGDRLAVGAEGRVLVWDLAGNRPVDELVGVEESVAGLVTLPDRRLLVATRTTVSEWDLGRVPPVAAAVGDGTDVLAVDAAGTRYGPVPGGLRITTADGGVTDVALPAAPCAVTPAPGGEAVVVASGEATELRRLPGGSVVASLEVRPCDASAVSFSPDGAEVAAVSTDGGVAVWDVGEGRSAGGGAADGEVTSIGWTGDGRAVVAGTGDGTIEVPDPGPEGGRRTVAIPQAEGSAITGVTPVAGEDRVVVTVESGAIHVVDVGDEEPVGEAFRWGGTELRNGTLSSDGRLLAALGRNGNLRLWDARRHTVLGPGLRAFLPPAEESRLVFTAPDRVAAWDGIGAALTWQVDVDAWADTACALAARPLTEDEWQQYLPGEDYAPRCT
jgi:WD40 repeat protein